jgi:hypothetical protein
VDTKVEIRRLAALFQCDESELGYLESLGGEALMKLRVQFQDSLISDYEPVLSKLAGTTAITPAAIAVKIATRYLGPTLTSYLSYYTPVKSAAKLAEKFPSDFMIEVAKEQIPERAKEMLKDFPLELMRPVTRGLVAEQAWSTMGGFVDYLPEEKSFALMSEVPDAESNLRISSYAQNKELVAKLVAKFDDDMLIELTKASLASPELMREVCLVAEKLPAESLEQMARLRDRFSEAEQTQLYKYARENDFSALADLYDLVN